ncbi:HlyD family efflux transporter periplasmic adaptor subunit, partial [Candidatus Nomurabacteria bacterium]|nr:HlyD family efflux transporter periplasmic adaptor subunit [Candidatus Nomurabacteria bacterium]
MAYAWIQSSRFKWIVSVLIIISVISGSVYLYEASKRIYVEKSQIVAPMISMVAPISGTLDKIYVKEGDYVRENQVLAEVSGSPVKAKTDGLIVYINNAPGTFVSNLTGSQNPIIKMIDPRELRVVGRVEEDKGLSDIKIGQNVIFTVDAFGSREYEGVVDSVSPTSRESDIVFSISDKREVKEF